MVTKGTTRKRLREGPSIKSLTEENRQLRKMIAGLKKKLEDTEWKLYTWTKNIEPFTPMRRMSDWEWSPTIAETWRRKKDMLGDFVARIVDGGKRRKMEVGGILFDPEGR